MNDETPNIYEMDDFELGQLGAIAAKPDANSRVAAALGIAPPVPMAPPSDQPLVAAPIASQDQITDDADYSRTNLYDIIKQGAKAVDQAMNLATESQHPRAYEVLAQLLAVQSANVDKLLQLQKVKKALTANTDNNNAMQAPQNINVANAIFVGSSNELVRMMRKEHTAPKVIAVDDPDRDE
jgi:hypothetical protein